MSMFVKTLWPCILTVIASLGTFPAQADDIGLDLQQSEFNSTFGGWKVQWKPYLWLPFLTGDVTIKGRTTDVDLDPIQVLTHLQGVPWMGSSEARLGPLALYDDIFYAKLGVSGGGVRARAFGASASLDFDETIVELGGTYQVMRWTSQASNGGFVPSTAIDVLAGARYWHQNMDVSVDLSHAVNVGDLSFSGGRAFARGGEVDWVDPIIGARLRSQFAPGQQVLLRADVGGFDVGSEFEWNVLGAYSFDFMKRDGLTFSGMLGWRILDVNYARGNDPTSYGYNVLQSGPVAGLTVSF
jgi:hypothetical protein